MLTRNRGAVDAGTIQNVEQELDRLRFLAHLTSTLREYHTSRDIIARASELLAHQLGLQGAGYATADAALAFVTVQGDWVEPDRKGLAGRYRLEDFGEGFAAEIRAGRIVAIDDVTTNALTVGRDEAFAAIGVRSFIDFPLLRKGRLAGLLYAFCDKPRVWRPDEISLVMEVAERVWTVLRRVQADEALHRSEERLRIAQEVAALGTFEWDIVNNINIWSPEIERLYGLEKGSFPGTYEAWCQCVHPDDLPLAEEHVRIALETGDFEAEWRIVRPNGEIAWILARAIVDKDEFGEPQRMTGANFDITQRKQAEFERDRYFELSIDCLAVASVHDGLWKRLNPAFTRILGWERDELLAKPYFDIVHPADLECAEAAAEALARGEAMAEFEQRIRCKDGSFRWISWNTTSATADGLIYCVGRDVTESRKAELALRASEARFRATFENAAVGMAHVAVDGTWLLVNNRFCQITGYDRDELLSLSFQDLIHPDDLAEDLAKFEPMMRGELDGYRMEKRYFRKDGTQIWVNLTTALQRVSGNAPLYCISVVEDITERKRAEELRELLVDELNHWVKNTLAIVQSLAHQTFRDNGRSADARAAFEGRLRALAATHNLLMREHWQKASLGELAMDALASLGVEGQRYSCKGPNAILEPKQAVTVAMALHELATNALKYGALRNDGGSIAIDWSISKAPKPRLRLTWQERGGPKVVAPACRGFGSIMIEKALAAELGGTAHIDFDAEGVVCTIDAPLPKTAAQPA